MSQSTKLAQRGVLLSPSLLIEDLKLWITERGLWWGASLLAHMLILVVMLLVVGSFAPQLREANERVYIASVELPEPVEPEIEVLATPPIEPPLASEIDLPSIANPGLESIIETSVGLGGDSNETAADPGVFGGGTVIADFVDKTNRNVWIAEIGDRSGPSTGNSKVPGIFGNRDPGGRGGGTGATEVTDSAVGRALAWIARHQSTSGNWSLDNFSAGCRDDSCSGTGSIKADGAATALGLLPFLAAGQTHRKVAGQKAVKKKAKNYQATIYRGIYWLLQNQKPNGDLSAGSEQVMYSHALATIALAEAYALSHDKDLAPATQKAVDFIVAAQHPETGGWRYHAGERGDTSVTGWQIMALKSAQIAGLKVPDEAIARSRRWLAAAAKNQGGVFAYEPNGAVTPPMTAVGLLGLQYLGAKRDSPALQEGIAYLMQQKPDGAAPNSYYWYYATQVLHNVPGPRWDEWNRHTRRILVESQSTTAGLCSQGSWDPTQPSKDAWGEQGGRLMVTSLNCLTLQVYYRYLPLYQLDKKPQAQ